MAMKRKFDIDSEDIVASKHKQLKLIPFPNCDVDNDVAMSDAEPLYPEMHHTRIASNASSLSDTPDSPVFDSPAYPTFDLYPLPFFSENGSVEHNIKPDPSHNVRLLQPSSSFAHHGTGCSQIPKLRVACASGLNGQRTMWSFCEQCGAISMVERD